MWTFQWELDSSTLYRMPYQAYIRVEEAWFVLFSELVFLLLFVQTTSIRCLQCHFLSFKLAEGNFCYYFFKSSSNQCKLGKLKETKICCSSTTHGHTGKPNALHDDICTLLKFHFICRSSDVMKSKLGNGLVASQESIEVGVIQLLSSSLHCWCQPINMPLIILLLLSLVSFGFFLLYNG